jgi:hypothetical protein
VRVVDAVHGLESVVTAASSGESLGSRTSRDLPRQVDRLRVELADLGLAQRSTQDGEAEGAVVVHEGRINGLVHPHGASERRRLVLDLTLDLVHRAPLVVPAGGARQPWCRARRAAPMAIPDQRLAHPGPLDRPPWLGRRR